MTESELAAIEQELQTDPLRLVTPAFALVLLAEVHRYRQGLIDLRPLTHPVIHSCPEPKHCTCGAAMFNDRGADMRAMIDALLHGRD